eukprot:1968369-Prorocentrum_lima.AAC.1
MEALQLALHSPSRSPAADLGFGPGPPQPGRSPQERHRPPQRPLHHAPPLRFHLPKGEHPPFPPHLLTLVGPALQ